MHPWAASIRVWSGLTTQSPVPQPHPTPPSRSLRSTGDIQRPTHERLRQRTPFETQGGAAGNHPSSPRQDRHRQISQELPVPCVGTTSCSPAVAWWPPGLGSPSTVGQRLRSSGVMHLRPKQEDPGSNPTSDRRSDVSDRLAGEHTKPLARNGALLSGPCIREDVCTGCADLSSCTDRTRGGCAQTPGCMDRRRG